MRSFKWAGAALAVAALSLTACTGGGGGGAASGQSGVDTGAGGAADIEFQTNLGASDPILQTLQDITDGYTTEHPDVTIDLVPMTDTYEADIKVRLASNDPPDIWSTHGWSLLRYSEFLEPLTDQPWAQNVNPALDAAMRDDQGSIYALPANTDVAGIVYNASVLDDLGIDPASLDTWDAFTQALEKIHADGITPISASGKDNWFAGNIADFIASGAFSESSRDQILQGTFPEEAYAQVLDLVKSWTDAGYFNADYSSAPQDDLARSLGEGTTAFVFVQNYLVGSALSYAPDATLGYMPVPSFEGDPYLVGGEGYAYGVSKTSPHKDQALDYLAFLAEPENLSVLATAIGGIPGLTTAESDLGPLQDSYDAFVAPGDVPLEPYFDRVYLPNGMWDTMVSTTDSVITGQSDVAGALNQMTTQFQALYGQD